MIVEIRFAGFNEGLFCVVTEQTVIDSAHCIYFFLDLCLLEIRLRFICSGNFILDKAW